VVSGKQKSNRNYYASNQKSNIALLHGSDQFKCVVPFLQLHQPFMILGLLCTAAAFIIIFVHVRGYSNVTLIYVSMTVSISD